MKTTTQKILIAGLILMVVLNICTLSFIILKARHHHFRGDGEHPIPGRFLGRKLHLTPEQEVAIEKVRKDHEEKMSLFELKKDSLRKITFALIKKDPFDTLRANEITIEMGNCHKEMDKQMTAHFLSIKALCTKQQLVYFNEFIDHISERAHGPGFGHRGMRRNRECQRN